MQQTKNQTPDMRQWSDAKLAKELAFARAVGYTDDPFHVDWQARLNAEAKRRDA